MRTPLLAFLLALAVLTPCGCLAPWREQGPGYATVAAQPLRDEAKAIAETERAARLVHRGKWDQAEQALQNALIADVTYGPAHNNLGKLYYNQGKFYLAAWEFEYTSKLMPDRPEPHNNLGMVYEAVDRLDQAITSYSMAHSMACQNPIFIGNLARVRLKQDEHDPQAQALLSDLLLYDTRPDWVAWAREQFAVAKLPTKPSKPGDAKSFGAPDPVEEIPPGEPLGKLRTLGAEEPETTEPSLKFPADLAAPD
jgi:Tfp pilus assembly protein PilF